MRAAVLVATCLIVFLLGFIIPSEFSHGLEGFISINCGGDGFTDTNTGITWSGDDDYLDSATELQRRGAVIPVNVNLNTMLTEDYAKGNVDNSKALETAMVFLPSAASRTKYCYSLPVSVEGNYLVRAMFPTSNLMVKSHGKERSSLIGSGSVFNLSVEATVVATIELDPVYAQTVELVLTAQWSIMYICLLPVNDSIPAISSIELRPLSRDMYLDGRGRTFRSNVGENKILSPSTYLRTVARINFGGDEKTPAMRFPHDPYDRLWRAYVIPEYYRDDYRFIYTSERTFNNYNPNVNYPVAVVQSALEPYKSNRAIIFPLYNISTTTRTTPYLYFSMCFLDLRTGFVNDTREVVVDLTKSFEDVWSLRNPISQNRTWVWWNYPEAFPTDKTGDLRITVSSPINYSSYSPSDTRLPPLINAFEVYEQVQRRSIGSTISGFGNFTQAWPLLKSVLSAILSLTDQDVDLSGDPCLPIPWKGLQCQGSYSFYLNLSSQGIDAALPLEYPNHGEPFRVVSETVLDISNNKFHGNIPQGLLELQFYDIILDNNNLSGFNISSNFKIDTLQMPTLSLYNNCFSTEDFVDLLNNLPSSVPKLSFRKNQLSGGIPLEIERLNETFILELDLSLNQLSGYLPVQLFRSANLTRLYLNGNQLSGAIPPEVKNLSNLYILSLSDNRFTGSLPHELFELRLSELLAANNNLSGEIPSAAWSSAIVLDLQNNSLTGMLPAKIWTSRIKSANLGNNKFTGVDLTAWCEEVLKSGFKPNVSLVWNNIATVVLTRDCTVLFGSLNVDALQLYMSNFILLGGNPWCTEKEHQNKTLLERYLCRFNESSDFRKLEASLPSLDSQEGSRSQVLIIMGVCGGALILLTTCALLLQLWKLYKRTKELQEIADALAKEDVRPPFFNFEDLMTATDDFSPANSLGKGAFGAVYKAVSASGSVLAVKLLFPTEQNIVDFLREMVLISGIKHRNLIQLKGCCVRDNMRFLVYEFAPNGSLAEALWGVKAQHSKLTWAQRLNICISMARGLAYLHEELQPKIIHRDIKPQNILLDEDWNVKIADFGLARPLNEDTPEVATTIGGTLGYFSPEYATLGILSEKLDVYSYGVVLLEIVSGRPCIDFSAPEEKIYLRTLAFKLFAEGRLEEIAEYRVVASEQMEEVLDVLKVALSCLNEDPTKRPAMSQIVSNLVAKSSDLAFDISSQFSHQHDLQLLLNDSTLAATAEILVTEETALLRSDMLKAEQDEPSNSQREQKTRNRLHKHMRGSSVSRQEDNAENSLRLETATSKHR